MNVSAGAAVRRMSRWTRVGFVAGVVALSCSPSASNRGGRKETTSTTSEALSAGTPWFPVGPLGASPNLGPLFDVATTVGLSETGRGTSVAANPQNPFDVYLGTAGGGLWEAPNLGFSTTSSGAPPPSGTPSVNPWSLIFTGGTTGAQAIGSIALDPTTCDGTRCGTIWVGTGEAGIRRETFGGTGLYKLVFGTSGGEIPFSAYFPTQEPGSANITGASIGSLALFKPSGASANRVYFTVTAAVTSSGYDATVFAPPPSTGYGVYMFDDNNPTTPIARENVPPGDPVDQNLPGSVVLTTDGTGNSFLVAGFYNRGLYRKSLPSGNWCPLDAGAPPVSGCPAPSTVLQNVSTTRVDHVGLASSGSTVMAAFSDCSNVWSGNGGGVNSFQCPSSQFVSHDGGATWTAGKSSPDPTCVNDRTLCTYSNYDHGLAVSPQNSNELYFGGFNVDVSLDGAQSFSTKLHDVHPDIHAVFPSPTTWNAQAQPGSGTQHLLYVACDGGLGINLLDPANADGNIPLGIPQPPVFSIDRLGVLPCPTGQTCTTAVMAGTNDNGTVLYNGGRYWKTLSSADVADTQFISSNQGLITWYAMQPTFLSTTSGPTVNTLTSRIPFASVTDVDGTEFGKTFGTATDPSTNDPSTQDGHGKMMLEPFVRDPVSNNFYFGTDRVYQVSGSALASNPSSALLTAISPRLSDALGACTRPGTDARGTCPQFQFCVSGQCRNYYTDIEKTDAISAIGSRGDHVFVGMYSGEFYKQGTGGTFVQVTNIPSKRPCSAKDIGVAATLAGTALGPTPFDSNAMANATGTPTTRCAPITSIDVKPNTTNQAYVTVGGFNNAQKHVFLYTNNGATDNWQSLTDGALLNNAPDTAAIVIRADPTVAGHTLLGTDVGLFERTADDSSGPWKVVPTVPSVPVDDVIFDPSLGRAYAGTHGRGVYMTVNNPVVEVFAGWMDPSKCPPNQPCIWDLLVYGQGFQQSGLSNPACTVNILDENGNVCTGGTADAFSGKTIQVLNSNGMIGQTVFNESDGKTVIAACFNGNCIGPSGTVPISACEPDATHPNRIISAVQVLCPNNNGVTVNVGKNCPQLQSPPATDWNPMLTGDPPPSSAPPITTVTLVAALDGMPLEALCSVTVPIFASDGHDDIIDRARTAFASSPTCQAAGVQVSPKPPTGGGDGEDFGAGDALHLTAPNAVGRALYVASITDPSSVGAPGICQRYDDFPGYATNQLDIMDTTFSTAPGGARGGSVTYTEVSPLGRCVITVPTTAGESAAAIAQSILNAYQAAYPTDSNPGCPYSSNPGDLVATSPFVPLAPGTLNSIAATEVDVCLNDTGVGFSIGPNGVPLFAATLSQAALFATGSLVIKDGTKVTEPADGFALVANAGSTQTALSPDVSVGAIVSVASVTLSDRDNVPGIIKTSGTVTLGNQDTIGGPIISSTGVVLPDLSQYQVTFPTQFKPGLTVQNGATATLAPGAYLATTIQSQSKLKLSTGTYFFTQIDVEPQTTVSLDDTNGPVIINLRDSAILRGAITSTRGGDPRLRIDFVGTSAFQLNAPFSGTAVAPNAEMDLAPGNGATYRGSFFAKNIVVADANNVIVHLPPQ